MAKPLEHSWKIDMDAEKQELRFITRIDDVVRQVCKIERFGPHVRSMFTVSGCRGTTAERLSDLPASSISETMKAREALWAYWEETDTWKMPKTAGSFSVKIEVDALAELKTEELGAKVTVKQIQIELAKLTPEVKASVLGSKKIQDRVLEIQAREEITLDLEAMID